MKCDVVASKAKGLPAFNLAGLHFYSLKEVKYGQTTKQNGRGRPGQAKY
jgi:hypothetical protein